MGPLEARLEKITFLVREIELAGRLAQLCAANDELARVWARRAVIRCADLIEHTEAIRRDLIAHDASAYPPLKRARTAFDDLFEQHFRVVRDRIAAHVQDLGFVERLDLWNSIDAGSLSVFIDGAREIHDRCLGGLGLPHFTPVVPFPETSDASLADTVRAYVARLPTGPSFGVDAFAGARPNTATIINLTPVHQRAQMIVALRRWIRGVAPFALDPQVGVNVRRVASASLVTDVVALGDCLFTRTGGASPIEGLDRLVEKPGVDVFARWQATTHLRDLLDELRGCRNTVAAHLEVDPSVDLGQLLARVDGVAPVRLLRTFDRASSLFHQVCEAEHYLGTYRIDGMPMHGVLSVSHGGVHRPYDPAGTSSRVGEIETRTIDASDAAAIDAAIDEWCATGDPYVRSALWDVAGRGAVVEVVPAAPRRIELRVFHARFASRVATADAGRFDRLMALARSLGTGSPVPLVEALLRGVEARGADLAMRARAAYAVSRIPLRKAESPRVDPFLADLLRHDLDVAHPAVLALYQLEDVTAPTAEPIAGRILAALADRPPFDRASAVVALVSRVWSGRLYRDPSAADADAAALVEAAVRLLPGDIAPHVVAQTRALAGGDAVGLLLAFAEGLPFRDDERERLYRMATSPSIELPRHAQLRRSARLNRATALHHLGAIDAARALCIEVLASLDYSLPSICVGVLEHAASCGVEPDEWSALIREACVLGSDDLARLDALAEQ